MAKGQRRAGSTDIKTWPDAAVAAGSAGSLPVEYTGNLEKYCRAVRYFAGRIGAWQRKTLIFQAMVYMLPS